MQADRKRVIFHIGLERTGTTSFQKFCHDSRRRLLDAGLLYPTRSLAFSRASFNHAALAASYLKSRDWVDYNIASSRSGAHSVLASLRAEISAAETASAVLISAEHFSSRFESNDIERLAHDFADFDCEIVVVLRAHEPRATSAYSSTIRAGRRVTPDAYFDELFLPANWYVRYRQTIERWEAVFGRSKVRALLYEEGGDAIGMLAKSGLTAGVEGSSSARYSVNAHHDASVLEAVRRVNERLSPMDDFAVQKLLSFKTAEFARSKILNALTQTPHRRIAIRNCVSADRLARLDEIASEDAAWLEESYGLDLPKTTAEPRSSDCDHALVRNEAEALLERLSWEPRLWLRLAERLKT